METILKTMINAMESLGSGFASCNVGKYTIILTDDEDGCGDGEQIYDDGRSQGRFEAYIRAIDIVKGGGVDGN